MQDNTGLVQSEVSFLVLGEVHSSLHTLNWDHSCSHEEGKAQLGVARLHEGH